jgi:AbiV family abortive infection protein
MTKPTVTLDADDLLHGAFYALEHAGHLLRDAVGLWNNKQYSNAVVLGVFAREEVGRFKILVEERTTALQSGPRDREAVRKRCSDHKEKLRAAPGGISIRFNAQVPELEGWQDPNHPNHLQAQTILHERIMRKETAQPARTHAARFAALYVDVDEARQWNRPSETTQGESGLLLNEIANDYAHKYGNQVAAPEFYENAFEAFKRWEGAPTLPVPTWPDLTGVALPIDDDV